MKKEIIRDKSFQLLVRLFKEAIKDGEIDYDESRIIMKTDSNVNQLYEYVQKAWNDNKLDENEKNCILKLVQKIQLDAESIAFHDQRITAEEAELLKIIDDMLEDFIEDSDNEA